MLPKILTRQAPSRGARKASLAVSTSPEITSSLGKCKQTKIESEGAGTENSKVDSAEPGPEFFRRRPPWTAATMTIPTVASKKSEADQAKVTINLNEKVYVTEVLQNELQDLLAVGLGSSVVIVELQIDTGDPDVNVDYSFLKKINHDSRVKCLAWSPETSLTATAPKCLKFATGGADYNIRLFSSDLGDNESVRILKGGHTDYVNSLAYHPEDGSQVVSGSDDHTVILWDSRNGRRLHTATYPSPVMSVNWHTEEVSKLLVAEKAGILHLYNIVSYHPILSINGGLGPLLAADWSPSNSLLVAAAIRSDVVVYDLSKRAPVARKHLRQEMVKSVRFSPLSEAIVATEGLLPDYSVKVANVNNTNVFDLLSHQPVGGISWHPKRNLLVVGHDEKVSIHHISNKVYA